MADGRFPKAYVNRVPAEGSDPIMQYVPFHTLDIGARKTGMPKQSRPEGMGLEHVGGTANGSK